MVRINVFIGEHVVTLSIKYLLNACVGFLVLMVTFSLPATSKEIEGVKIPESVILSDGSKLLLNGAGIRSKFLFDIYVGALYLAVKRNSIDNILQDRDSKRVLMHFLYDEVAAKKIIKGWNEGFEDNLADEEFSALESRLEKFNGFFGDVKKGDEIILDYLRDGRTQVTINGELKGTIQGQDFYTALLKVWLGDHPADKSLKKAMSGK